MRRENRQWNGFCLSFLQLIVLSPKIMLKLLFKEFSCGTDADIFTFP